MTMTTTPAPASSASTIGSTDLPIPGYRVLSNEQAERQGVAVRGRSEPVCHLYDSDWRCDRPDEHPPPCGRYHPYFNDVGEWHVWDSLELARYLLHQLEVKARPVLRGLADARQLVAELETLAAGVPREWMTAMTEGRSDG